MNAGQVGHPHQHGAAAHVLGGRGDHRARLDVLLDDRARDGRPHIGVVHGDTRVLQRNLGADHLRFGVGEFQLRLFVVGLGQGPGLEQRPRAFHLRVRDGPPGPGRHQASLGFGQAIARRALVHLHQQEAFLDHVSSFRVDREDLSRGLGLHLDSDFRLDHAGRLHIDLNVPDLHRGAVVQRRNRLKLILPAGRQRQNKREPDCNSHDQCLLNLSRLLPRPVLESPSISPSDMTMTRSA